jgi:hypothetical protein
VSWRAVPTFAAGVLATLAAALLVRCRGSVGAFITTAIASQVPIVPALCGGQAGH